MAKEEKKFVEAITAMEDDFPQWYTDVVKKAELIDYSSVKGCMIIKPAGYAIWENIQKELDKRFKETGVENVYMPMFIPESLLQKEKDHVEGFAPEVAWVTHGGSEPLENVFAVALLPKRFSASIIKILFSHTEICRNFITSGYRLCVGKRLLVLSCVQESFCGRRVILFTQPQKRL